MYRAVTINVVMTQFKGAFRHGINELDPGSGKSQNG